MRAGDGAVSKKLVLRRSDITKHTKRGKWMLMCRSGHQCAVGSDQKYGQDCLGFVGCQLRAEDFLLVADEDGAVGVGGGGPDDFAAAAGVGLDGVDEVGF